MPTWLGNTLFIILLVVVGLAMIGGFFQWFLRTPDQDESDRQFHQMIDPPSNSD